jgi:CheY-like chemotaxis protein
MVTAMATSADILRPVPSARALRKVMIVTPHAGCAMPDGLLAAVDAEVVVIESVGRAYSQIKQVSPHMVIMCLSFDDIDGCRVLSMLKVDPETSHIPVVMCTSSAPEAPTHEPMDVDTAMPAPCALAA